MNNDDHWSTPGFRQNIIAKIEEAMQQAAVPTSKSSSEMESHVFNKAKNKEEYLGYVARLILHVRDINNSGPKKMNMAPNMQSTSADPMNALRAMTQPGTPGQMMNMPQQGGPQQINPASNLLQSLNQRPNLQNKIAAMQTGVMNQMGGPMGTMQPSSMQGPMPQSAMQQGMQQGPMHGSPMGNTMGGSMVNANAMQNQMTMNAQMGNTMPGPMPGQMGGVMANQMTAGQVPAPMNSSMSHNQMNVQMSHMGVRKITPEGVMMSGQANVPFMPNRCAVPNQFLRQATPPPNQAPMQMNTVVPSMIPSPAMIPAPSPTQLPTTGGLVGPGMRPAGPGGMAPSPNNSTNLNTPGGQLQPTPSPLSANDEQAFQEKVRQLSRYIEPLRRVIQRSGSGDSEKMSKMRKLLEILSSSGHSGQRITMDTLLKCETVLEKLDIKCGMKEQHPLIEAISSTLQNPNANHTFHRTFEPIMSTLNGRPLKNMPRPLKRKLVEESTSDIPEVLQGEVARLDQRFKVSLDPVQQNSSKSVHLLCWLDDRHLPCIPPVQITIPEDYPNSSPKCDMSNYEYGATKFLQLVQEALRSRISKLPPRYTMSQLLDTWENSVRETCSLGNSNSVDLLPLPVI